MLAEDGRADDARALVGPAGTVPDPEHDWLWLETTTAAAHVRAYLGDEAACAVLFERLLPFAGRADVTAGPFLGGIDLALARLAGVVGDDATARRYAGAAVAMLESLATPRRSPGRCSSRARCWRRRTIPISERRQRRCSTGRTGCPVSVGLTPVLAALDRMQAGSRSHPSGAIRMQGAGGTVGPMQRRIPHRTGTDPTARPPTLLTVVHRHAAGRRPPGRRHRRARGRRHGPGQRLRGGTPASTASSTVTTRSRTTCGSRSSPSGCPPSPSTSTASSASTTSSTARSRGRRRARPPGRSEATAASQAAAHDAACELSSLLDLHLRFEDADILPLYLPPFTEDEYAEIEDRRVPSSRRAGCRSACRGS